MSRKAIVVAHATVLGLLIVGAILLRLTGGTPPANQIEASGRIEGRITQVTPKVSGTVAELPVDEGQSVDVGARLMRLEEPMLLERRRAAQGRAASLERQLAALRIDHEVAQNELPLRIAQAQAALTEAQARLAAAQAAADATRLTTLAQRQLASAQQAETARLRADVAAKTAQAALAALDAAGKNLSLARLGVGGALSVPARLEPANACAAGRSRGR